MPPTTKKATQEQTKLHNKRLVLKTIYDQGQISRADIARATYLARTTVSSAVSALMAEGLVEEVGQQVLNRGKPATLLRVIADARHLIGVDLANSEFRGAIADLRGNIIHRLTVPRNNHRGKVALELVYRLIDNLITAASSPLLGIGVGTPGLVDAQKGCVRTTIHFDWRDLPLQKLLATRYNLPVYIANDSHIAALGEYTFGSRQGTSNLITLTVGLGVSAGVVLNGKLHFGDSFGAGEIGHITVVRGDAGKSCLCGNTGCLETVVNESVLIEQAKNIALHNPHSKLHQFAPNPEAITDIEVVRQAFDAGDEDLQQEIMQMGKYLGYAIAGIVSILNVERIFVSGSLARFGTPLLEAMQDELRACFHPLLAAKTQIEFSDLGPDIVIQGAVALVLSSELGLV